MSRPPRDPKDAKAIDEGTDTNDTIDWLLKNVPNNNGRVGMLGISYPGWLTVMALLDPHPALKAASPQASPADMFLGDDFHHNGAFRLSYGFEYVAMMETDKSNTNFKFDRYDTFEWYLKLGALSNVNPKYFKGKMPTWNDFVAHPNYDDFWKKQAFGPVPEARHGADAARRRLVRPGGFLRPAQDLRAAREARQERTRTSSSSAPGTTAAGRAGPGDKLGQDHLRQRHGQALPRQGAGAVLRPSSQGQGRRSQPEALMFQTGSNKWVEHDRWPPKSAATRKLYFHPDGKLALRPPPAETKPAFDEYVSDPAKPVPYRPRPVTPTYPGPEWQVWMVEDQRFTQHRPDVLTYETEPLEEDVTVAGSLTAHLFAATSGTDCDWIVRLIDVYPEKVKPRTRAWAAFSSSSAANRCAPASARASRSPSRSMPDEVNEYTIDLHWSHHCFRKGHKIMVQVQSTWFPLIDRNPQKYVPNIFEAKDSDFQSAEQRVYRSPRLPSHVSMQVMKRDDKK